MRAITGRAELLKKLKKHNLVTNGFQFYLSDFHKSSVGWVVANKFIDEGLMEESSGHHWFEKSWRLKNKKDEK